MHRSREIDAHRPARKAGTRNRVSSGRHGEADQYAVGHGPDRQIWAAGEDGAAEVAVFPAMFREEGSWTNDELPPVRHRIHRVLLLVNR